MTEYEHHLKNSNEIGKVISVTNSLVYSSGLPGCRIGEKVITENGEVGMVQGLLDSAIEILMFSNRLVNPGVNITRSGGAFKIPVGNNFLTRSIDPLGNSIDSGSPVIKEDEFRDINPEVPGISVRSRIDKPFHTGVTIVDTMIPLGSGQRELILGDSKSGKTAFLLQTMLNQKGRNVVCIYVAIGKKKADIKGVENFVEKNQLSEFTLLIASDSATNPGVIYLAPFTGMTFAEYFRDQGRDVLLILDDMTTHARFYREISLQGKKSPGREGYPGDIYYLHSRLLERAGKFNLAWGQTPTITLLPVVETINGDFTGLIPTNIMSMTDGHIYFDTDLLQKGETPAVNAFLSVSRVGNQTRNQLEKDLDFEIRNTLSQYRTAVTFSRFGVELSENSKNLLRQGEKISTIFSQNQHMVISEGLRLIFFSLLMGGFWESKIDVQVGMDKEKLITAYQEGKLKSIESKLKLAKSLQEIKDFIKVNTPVFLKICS
jgi:F-type H+-transporting ATPase subunit alpha